MWRQRLRRSIATTASTYNGRKNYKATATPGTITSPCRFSDRVVNVQEIHKAERAERLCSGRESYDDNYHDDNNNNNNNIKNNNNNNNNKENIVWTSGPLALDSTASLYTSSRSPEVRQAPFRDDPKYRPSSLCPQHHFTAQPHKRDLSRDTVPLASSIRQITTEINITLGRNIKNISYSC